MGVSHRIAQLADRPEGFVPEKAKPFESLVPLLEVIAASTGRSAAGKKVREEYETMIRKLGTEFAILREVPIEDIKRECGYLTAEGIRRLREGKVERLPGFDGEYGAVRLFTPDEIESPEGQMSMSGLFETETDSEAGNRTASGCEKHEREQSGEENFSAKALAGEPDKRADRPADFLSLLNEKQREAAELPSSCLAVIAGPGTGKTGTLTARIKCLIEKRRVKPSEITAVTFTNQAAGELRERLKRELANKRGQSLIQTGTFHSICLKMLEAAGEKADLADPLELSALAEEILEEESKPLRPTEFLRRVSRKKTELALAQEMSEKMGEKEENSFQKAFDRYRTAMEAQGWLDFDDLLIRTVSLLRENCPAICRFCSHFRYLLVDEFQDISPLQYALIREWNKEGRELFVIGDPDQAIYGFRGSDAECFKRLLQDIPETKVIALQENYRSTEPIVKAACSVISHNPGGERTLAAKAGSGDPVRVVKAGGRRSEGIFTAREINRMIGGIDMLDAQERGTFLEKGPRSFSDIAVLCRTNRQAEEMEECLRTEGIPYIVTGRGTFLEADTVREAEGFFALLTEAGEGMEKRTVQFLNRRIGGEKLLQLLEKYRPMAGKKPADLLKAWMGDRDLKEDEPLARLASMAMFHKTMKDFLFTLFWGREGDLKRCGKKRYAADAVSLMTLHASKGLEFPAVIIPGMRKGSLPLETEQAEEERRLFYVGMTRAREELILVTSGEPSPFLGELPEAEIQNEELAGTPEARARQMSLFDFFPSGEMPSA
ncbi:MAG: UvrD-helicase domain-containing protein [Clostridium sp.]